MVPVKQRCEGLYSRRISQEYMTLISEILDPSFKYVEGCGSADSLVLPQRIPDSSSTFKLAISQLRGMGL